MVKRITDEQTLTAYHEAGHAAMALTLGIPFKYLSIVGDEESDGRVIGQLQAWFRPDAEWDHAHEEYMQALIKVALAGPEAERRVAGRYNGSGPLAT